MKARSFVFRAPQGPVGPLGILLSLFGLIVVVAVAVMGFFLAITAGLGLFLWNKVKNLTGSSTYRPAPDASMTVEDANGNTIATVSRFS
jgi:hypothetical protein